MSETKQMTLSKSFQTVRRTENKLSLQNKLRRKVKSTNIGFKSKIFEIKKAKILLNDIDFLEVYLGINVRARVYASV